MAAYNEEDAIAGVLEALPTELCGHGVTPIVVVDGGTDDTAEVVERAGHVAVRHEINRGQGDALRTGFALALERKAAIVVTMDADGQHRPEDLPRLLEPLLADEADYVQGSRYLGEYDDAGGARDLGIRFFTRVVNLASGAGVTDCTNGFRAIRGRGARAAPAGGAALLGVRADHRVGAPRAAHPRGLGAHPVADPR